MPHLVILYTPNLERDTDMTALCRALADAMIAFRDDAGRAVFPVGGTRVLAYPAAHFAVADGGAAGRAAGTHKGVDGTGDGGDYAFVYLNLRMGQGRTDAVVKAAGAALREVAQRHFAPIFDQRHIGITFQVDVGTEAFDSKHSNLHPLFNKN
ncbi:MAG: 5-carboxymethyl-2-hydroxymuconate isomerase [Burkholderiaceae bacterium]|nr:5-carboxymethyl-2-hydroxymuconate isomerase [Burkholderiaceae bacterium]